METGMSGLARIDAEGFTNAGGSCLKDIFNES